VSAEQPSEGTACLKVADEYACQDKIAVQGGKRYRLSLTVRCDSAPEGSVYAQISFRGTGVSEGWAGPALVDLGPRNEKAVFVTGGDHGWRRMDCVLAAPPAADQLLVYLRKRSGTPGAAYYDDVRLAPTDDPATTGGGAAPRSAGRHVAR